MSLLKQMRFGTMLIINIKDNIMLESGCHVYVPNQCFSNLTRPIIDQRYAPSATVVIQKGAWLIAKGLYYQVVPFEKIQFVTAAAVVTKSLSAGVVASGVTQK